MANGVQATEPAGEVRPESIGDVPVRVVNTYSRLWQFETWLRAMVYVELRAKLGDSWADDLKKKPGHQQADASLTHMPTAESSALSYSQLPALLELIEAHWDCFETYFPPRDLWHAKLREIKQIRNRVAHFRAGHADDYARVLQFLRDLDKSFWRYCTSYNNGQPFLPQRINPVAKRFLPLDPLPFVEFEKKRWAQIGTRNKELPVGMTVHYQQRPWANITTLKAGQPGLLYDIRLFAQDGRGLDYRRFLDRTRALHPHLVHVLLDSFSSEVRVTIPSVLGTKAIVSLIEKYHEAAVNSIVRAAASDKEAVIALASQWPEYVLGPESPLAFLSPDMPCSFFGV
jgi:hypothetical protein